MPPSKTKNSKAKDNENLSDLPRIKVAASILSGDFAQIAEECKRIEQSGADYLHVDIMDGHFVDNLTFGPAMVAAINRSTKMFLDVHLMIYNPYDAIERYVEAGADLITFHSEATEDVQETLDFIHRCNIKAGLAICPETPLSLILRYLDKCEMILLMTVNPGHGGQPFMPEVLEKIETLNEMRKKLNLKIDIEVDGGINPETASLCIEAGANVLVAGSYLFRTDTMAEGVNLLRNASQ